MAQVDYCKRRPAQARLSGDLRFSVFASLIWKLMHQPSPAAPQSTEVNHVKSHCRPVHGETSSGSYVTCIDHKPGKVALECYN